MPHYESSVLHLYDNLTADHFTAEVAAQTVTFDSNSQNVDFMTGDQGFNIYNNSGDYVEDVAGTIIALGKRQGETAKELTELIEAAKSAAVEAEGDLYVLIGTESADARKAEEQLRLKLVEISTAIAAFQTAATKLITEGNVNFTNRLESDAEDARNAERELKESVSAAKGELTELIGDVASHSVKAEGGLVMAVSAESTFARKEEIELGKLINWERVTRENEVRSMNNKTDAWRSTSDSYNLDVSKKVTAILKDADENLNSFSEVLAAFRAADTGVIASVAANKSVGETLMARLLAAEGRLNTLLDIDPKLGTPSDPVDMSNVYPNKVFHPLKENSAYGNFVALARNAADTKFSMNGLKLYEKDNRDQNHVAGDPYHWNLPGEVSNMNYIMFKEDDITKVGYHYIDAQSAQSTLIYATFESFDEENMTFMSFDKIEDGMATTLEARAY